MTRRGTGEVIFCFPAEVCAACPLRPLCTSSPDGRRVVVGPHEPLLAHAQARQRTPEFKAVYNGMRSTVETGDLSPDAPGRTQGPLPRPRKGGRPAHPEGRGREPLTDGPGGPGLGPGDRLGHRLGTGFGLGAGSAA